MNLIVYLLCFIISFQKCGVYKPIENHWWKMLNILVIIAMAQCKKDITTVRLQWSYVFLALTHQLYLLTHQGCGTHKYPCKLGHHWFRSWLVTCSAPSHYLNQCLISYTPRNEVRGGILDSACLSVRLSVCLSVCLSVNLSCPPCSIYSSGWILSIFGTNDH